MDFFEERKGVDDETLGCYRMKLGSRVADRSDPFLFPLGARVRKQQMRCSHARRQLDASRNVTIERAPW